MRKPSPLAALFSLPPSSPIPCIAKEGREEGKGDSERGRGREGERERRDQRRRVSKSLNSATLPVPLSPDLYRHTEHPVFFRPSYTRTTNKGDTPAKSRKFPFFFQLSSFSFPPFFLSPYPHRPNFYSTNPLTRPSHPKYSLCSLTSIYSGTNNARAVLMPLTSRYASIRLWTSSSSCWKGGPV